MNKILYTLTLLTTLLANSALVARDFVYVENDTPYVIAVGLYRTKNSHSRLDVGPDGYELADGVPVPLVSNTLVILPPLASTNLQNYSIKYGTDRDVWFSRDLISFANSAGKGTRYPSVHFTNVGSFVGSVYIADNQKGALEAFSSREKAFAASRFSLEEIKSSHDYTGGGEGDSLTVLELRDDPRYKNYVRKTPPPSRKK